MKKVLFIVALIAMCIASGCLCDEELAPATKTTSSGVVANSQNYKIDLSPTSVDGTVGYSIQFVAKVYDNNGYVPNARVEWVVTRGSGIMNSNGVFVPTSTGEVIISAKAGNAVSSALITVKSESHYSRYYYSYYDDQKNRNHYDHYYNNYRDNYGTTYSDLCSREHNHGTSC